MKTRIGELCRAVKIENPYQLQKACNFSPSQATRLYKDEVEAISLSVLETLCNALQCSPNDIFGYDVAPVAAVSVKADKPPKQKGVSWAGNPGGSLAETLAEGNSGKPFNHSTLELAQMSSDNETLLSTVTVAERLNVSRKSVNDYIIQGKLPAVKGKQNHNFIRESDLLAFMAKK
jgi:excisionase family DNA binding protein